MPTTDCARTFRLLLEYDGTDFAGFQLQGRGERTVQGVLEAAIRRLSGLDRRVHGAGRTDAGVHALGQVAAFTTGAGHSVETFVRGLNALLPADIAVREAVEAPADFDPRRHARWRWYRYTVWNAPERSPLWRRTAWHVREPLDDEAMAREAAELAGEHDLASFGAALAEGRGTRRRVARATVRRRGDLVLLDIEASAFLPHQVRRTAGALVEIGSGHLAAGTFAAWLAAPKSGTAGPAAPPHGLCLMRVTYDAIPPFPRREGGWGVRYEDL